MLWFPAFAYSGESAAFLSRNCIACHQGTRPAAGVSLDQLPERWDDAATRSLWVRVQDAVASGAMPPGGVKVSGSREFINVLAARLRTAELKAVRVRGRAVLRRLNRYEFENSLRDLLDAPWLQLRDGLPEDGLVQRLNKSGPALDLSLIHI